MTSTRKTLYWHGGNFLQKYNLGTSTLTTINAYTAFATAGIAFDNEQGDLYYADNTGIWVTNRGFDQHAQQAGSMYRQAITGLYVDGPNEYIYWAETTGDTIKRADLTGVDQNIVTISNGNTNEPPDDGSPFGVAIDTLGGSAFWLQALGYYRSDLTPGSSA